MTRICEFCGVTSATAAIYLIGADWCCEACLMDDGWTPRGNPTVGLEQA